MVQPICSTSSNILGIPVVWDGHKGQQRQVWRGGGLRVSACAVDDRGREGGLPRALEPRRQVSLRFLTFTGLQFEYNLVQFLLSWKRKYLLKKMQESIIKKFCNFNRLVFQRDCRSFRGVLFF